MCKRRLTITSARAMRRIKCFKNLKAQYRYKKLGIKNLKVVKGK